MDNINNLGTPKITCTYRKDWKTETDFKCNAIQRCCGDSCCDDENLDYYLIGGGVAVLLLVLFIGIKCWYIIRKRKRNRDIIVKPKQGVSNMLSANGKECVVTLVADDTGKNFGSQTGKSSKIPKNLSSISFTQVLFPPPSTKIEKSIAGSRDQQPLLDDCNWDGKGSSVPDASHMNE